MRSGLHTVNELLTVLNLRAHMRRACVGHHFHGDTAGRSSKHRLVYRPIYRLYMRMTSRHAWTHGLITIFSAYIMCIPE